MLKYIRVKKGQGERFQAIKRLFTKALFFEDLLRQPYGFSDLPLAGFSPDHFKAWISKK